MGKKLKRGEANSQVRKNMDTIIRLNEVARVVREDILRMTTCAGSGHPGGSLSVTDLIVALYFHKMRHDPKNPGWADRDRFILSKGHACPALYAVLARCGYFPLEELSKLRKLGSILQGHPEYRKCPGVEASTGPLGQGLSFANGVALAGRLDKKSYNSYVMIGDGETQEGQIWEAALTSAHYKLDRVIAILDNNNLQIDGFNDDVKSVKPIADKWRAFGWHVTEIDGHNFTEILNALDEADKLIGRPKMIIAHTIKGKGIACMENRAEWHGKACTPDELKVCLAEFRKNG